MIVHYDIWLGNVLLDGALTPKVIVADIGLARPRPVEPRRPCHGVDAAARCRGEVRRVRIWLACA